MTVKYELRKGHIEVRTKPWKAWSERDIIDVYGTKDCDEELLATADTAEALEEAFEQAKGRCRTWLYKHTVGYYLEADVLFVEICDCDDDGEFIQSSAWADTYAEPYQPDEDDEEEDDD